MIDFKGYPPSHVFSLTRFLPHTFSPSHVFEKEVIPLNVRWYVAYPLSYGNLEEISFSLRRRQTRERGIAIDHSTMLVKYSPELEKALCKRKKHTTEIKLPLCE